MSWKKAAWIICLLVLALATYVVIDGLETEMAKFEIGDQETAKDEYETEEVISDVLFDPAEEGKWEIDNAGAFFVEYRMQRDRVRDREIELLNEIIESDEASEESQKEAEEKLLELVDLMEKELQVENLLRGKGYEDALFFYRNDVATVMLHTGDLSEVEIAQVSDAVAGIVGIARESIQIMMRS